SFFVSAGYLVFLLKF
ncbi:hypothetical protein N499_0647B, partial [Wolbachia pipientis wVitA]